MASVYLIMHKDLLSDSFYSNAFSIFKQENTLLKI